MLKALVTIIDDETGKVYAKDLKIPPVECREYIGNCETTVVHGFRFEYAWNRVTIEERSIKE